MQKIGLNIIIILLSLGNWAVFADTCEEIITKPDPWQIFYEECLDKSNQVKASIPLAVNFIIKKSQEKKGVYPSSSHIPELFVKMKLLKITNSQVCDLVKIYSKHEESKQNVYQEWFTYFSCDKKPKVSDDLSDNLDDTDGYRVNLFWLSIIVSIFFIINLWFIFLIIIIYHKWWVRPLIQEVQEEISNISDIPVTQKKFYSPTHKGDNTKDIATSNQIQTKPSISSHQTSDNPVKEEILILKTVATQLLQIRNMDEGKKIVKTATQKIDYLKVAYGIPSQEAGEQKIFRFDIKHPETIKSIRDIYTIVSLEKMEHTINFLVPCGITGRVPSTLLSLFYSVDPNVSAIRQLDSHTPTKIHVQFNKQKEIIYFTVKQMGKLV